MENARLLALCSLSLPALRRMMAVAHLISYLHADSLAVPVEAVGGDAGVS
jgi:hypothetical protein